MHKRVAPHIWGKVWRESSQVWKDNCVLRNPGCCKNSLTTVFNQRLRNLQRKELFFFPVFENDSCSFRMEAAVVSFDVLRDVLRVFGRVREEVFSAFLHLFSQVILIVRWLQFFELSTKLNLTCWLNFNQWAVLKVKFYRVDFVDFSFAFLTLEVPSMDTIFWVLYQDSVFALWTLWLNQG